jgi:ribose-phosphate pyrophosphokinase
MSLRIVSGTANRPLADTVGARLGVPVGGTVRRFPDGEMRPVVEDARGDDVYLVQPTGPPVNENVVELLLSLDACRRAGAGRITAVVPYFGYARQDRRSRSGQAVGARVIADALAAAGAQRLVVIDPHTSALEAMCAMPVEMVTAVPGLAGALAPVTGETLVVAPDFGAVKLARHYATLLGTPVAVVRKHRETATTVRAEELVGEVRNRPAIVVDDMISTGGTVEAAVHALLAHAAADITVAATHGPLAETAAGRLGALPLRRLVVTDSVRPDRVTAIPRTVHSLTPLLADVISRLHRDEPLDDLLVRT